MMRSLANRFSAKRVRNWCALPEVRVCLGRPKLLRFRSTIRWKFHRLLSSNDLWLMGCGCAPGSPALKVGAKLPAPPLWQSQNETESISF